MKRKLTLLLLSLSLFGCSESCVDNILIDEFVEPEIHDESGEIDISNSASGTFTF